MIWLIIAAYVYAVCRFFTGSFAVNRTDRLLYLAACALGTRTLVNGQPVRTYKSPDFPMIGRRRQREASRSLLKGLRP